MIKRLIGAVAALGIIALLVFVVLHRAKYRSLIGHGGEPVKTEQSAE